VIRRLIPLFAVLLAASALPVVGVATAGAQTDGPAPGVVYSARKGPSQVRLVSLGKSPDGESLVLVDAKVECDGFEPQGRLVAVVEEEGRFEVEGAATQPGTTDVITGEFDDIDGKVRSDGAVLEIDVEIEGEDNAGSSGRCEQTQQWRLEPRRSAAARRVDGAAPTDARLLASNGDALFTLAPGDDADGELARVDPATLTTTWTVDAPAGASAVAVGGDAVWLLDSESLAVSRVGALSGEVEATVPLVSPEAAVSLDVISPLLVASASAAWIAIDEAESVFRIDAVTNEVTIATVLGRVDALAPAADGIDASVVATSGGDANLVHLGERTGEVRAVPLEDLPTALAADTGRVWTRSTDRLAAYDAPTLELTGQTSSPRLATGQLSDLVLALAPGAWTPSTRGLEVFDASLTRAFDVPVVGSAANGLVAAEGAVFVIDSGYLVKIDAS
jgi:hypothetical protein